MRAAVLLVALAGCLRSTAFECQTSDQCVRSGTAGTCEAVGFCSFADALCPSGQRYGGLAGGYSNTCVDPPQIEVDAAIDAPRCPASYMALSGAAHVYRLISASASWQTQRDACIADGNQLVIPQNASEVAALIGLSHSITWIGIDDLAVEGQYLTVLGLAPPFLPWDNSEPDNSPGNQDCVEVRTNGKLATQACGLGRPAICECTP